MTDNTQAEHMSNSSQSTPYAQAELEEILAHFRNGTINPDPRKWAMDEADLHHAKQALLDWHDKQVEELLDRLDKEVKRAYDKEGDFLEMAVDIIEAERTRLRGDDE